MRKWICVSREKSLQHIVVAGYAAFRQVFIERLLPLKPLTRNRFSGNDPVKFGMVLKKSYQGPRMLLHTVHRCSLLILI